MRLILFIFIVVILFVLYVRHLEETAIFFPTKELIDTPAEVGIDFEDILFSTGDWKELHGWFVRAQGANKTILFLHGNAGNIGDRLGKIKLFHDLGLNVFIFDYRGYGRSGGKPSEENMYEDSVAAYDYLITREDVDKRNVIVYGASLGGAAAIDLATKRKVSRLIIDSSFTSAVDMAKRIFPIAPSFLIRSKFDSLEKVKKILEPKLFFHSREDEVIPFALGKKLYEASAGIKEFVIIEGGHNDGHIYDRDRFLFAVRRFLNLEKK